MQSLPKKSFSLETDLHKVLTTFEPSRIHFTLTNKMNRRTTSAVYYDSTLPPTLNEECEAVTDLFEYLQGKPPSEMQVEGDSLNFKVVRIKKERWYSIPIHQQVQKQTQQQEIKRENKMEVEMQEENSVLKSLMQERDGLVRLNDELKNEVERLQAANQELQARLESKELQILIDKELIEQNYGQSIDQQLEVIPEILQSSHSQSNVMRRLTLASTLTQINPDYRVENGIITKLSQEFVPFLFEERIRSGDKVYMSLQVVTNIPNSWIIFGVMTAPTDQAYIFRRGCIAYSGSLGVIFNQMDTIDLPSKPTKNDRIGVRLNNAKYSVQWMFNGVLACTHRMGAHMWEQELHPFLILCSNQNAVRINCDQ